MKRALIVLAACSTPAHKDDIDRTTPPPDPVQGSAAAPVSTCATPGSTTPPSPVAQLAAGILDTCARLDDGSTWCWGQHGTGLVDNDVIGPKPCPIATRSDGAAPAPSPGNDDFACKLDSGEVSCTDENDRKLARDPNSRGKPLPFKKIGVTGATQLAVGLHHACAVVDNSVVCWGDNSCGQAGGDVKNPERCGSPAVPPTTIRWAR